MSEMEILQQIYYCNVFELVSISLVVGILLIQIFFKRW